MSVIDALLDKVCRCITESATHNCRMQTRDQLACPCVLPSGLDCDLLFWSVEGSFNRAIFFGSVIFFLFFREVFLSSRKGLRRLTVR